MNASVSQNYSETKFHFLFVIYVYWQKTQRKVGINVDCRIAATRRLNVSFYFARFFFAFVHCCCCVRFIFRFVYYIFPFVYCCGGCCYLQSYSYWPEIYVICVILAANGFPCAQTTESSTPETISQTCLVKRNVKQIYKTTKVKDKKKTKTNAGEKYKQTALAYFTLRQSKNNSTKLINTAKDK